MSTLYWLKIARRAKLYKQPEYPNIEALLEAESQQPSDDFRTLAKVVPAVIAAFGFVTAVMAVVTQHNNWLFLSTLGSGALALGVWYIFDRLDKKIPPSRVDVRKHAKKITERMCGFSNIVGVEPAFSPAVGSMLDEAARIYLKHRTEDSAVPFANNRAKASIALEEGMARLMELGLLPNCRAQDLEVEKGWAFALLQEMREMDVALDQHLRTALATDSTGVADPRANLRDARMELMRNESAIAEFEQNQNR